MFVKVGALAEGDAAVAAGVSLGRRGRRAVRREGCGRVAGARDDGRDLDRVVDGREGAGRRRV